VPQIEPVEVEDAGHRISDTMRLHILAGAWNQWAAFRLSDGSSDGQTYPTFADAYNHQATFMQDLTMYLQIPRDDCSPDTAQRLLNFWRQARDAGFRPPDPDSIPKGGAPFAPERIELL
jgi:hypothetical protein